MRLREEGAEDGRVGAALGDERAQDRLHLDGALGEEALVVRVADAPRVERLEVEGARLRLLGEQVVAFVDQRLEQAPAHPHGVLDAVELRHDVVRRVLALRVLEDVELVDAQLAALSGRGEEVREGALRLHESEGATGARLHLQANQATPFIAPSRSRASRKDNLQQPK